MKIKSEDQTHRVRNRQHTEAALYVVFEHMQSLGETLSISGLAKRAGVSAALIHNRYPDLAEKVRAATGKDARSQRNAKEKLLAQEKAKNQAIRLELENLRKEIVDLASVNESLRVELALQSAIATGKVRKIS